MKSELVAKRILGGLGVAAALLLTGCQDTGTPSANTGGTGGGKPYPLDVCIVSDEKLGSMGEPVVLVYNGQEVKFCCKSCKPDFEKEPAKYLAKLAKK